jgi:hypothetical protein
LARIRTSWLGRFVAAPVLPDLPVLLFLLFLLTACDLATDLTGVRDIDHFTSAEFAYAEPVTGPAIFRLIGINGSIEITGVPGLDTLKVWGIRQVGSDTQEDADSHLPQLEVRFSRFISSLQVETIQPGDTEGRSFTVEYHCLVPSDWEIRVTNINGGIAISAFESGVTVGNINGDLDLEDLNGSFDIALINGGIRLDSVEGEGDLVVTNGSITGQVALSADGDLLASTVNGIIALAVPDTVGAELTVTVVNGTISVTGLPLTMLSSSATHLNAQIGDGSGRITLAAVNGTIALTGY